MNLLRMIFGVLVLLLFLLMGIAHVVNPDYFLKRSGVRKGGEMLTEMHRAQFQLIGIIVAAFALYVLYQMFRS